MNDAHDPVDRAIAETHAFLASRPEPDLADDVLRRIRQLGLQPLPPPRRSILGRMAETIWTPREVSFRLRPAYGVLAAAALLLLVLLPGTHSAPADPEAALHGTVPAADPPLFVQFRFHATQASDVRLAGTFTGWEPRHQLRETAPGTWSVILPLSRGVHDYAFVVDGERWVPDPYATQVADGFGGTNSRIALLLPEGEPPS